MFLPLRVIIIEDNDDDALIMLRELRRGGFEPEHIQVQTPDEFQSALDNETWDIILSDYSLPSYSAPAALKQLRKSRLNIPFIVVSGAVGEEIAVQLMQHGAADYINKDKMTRLCPTLQRELDNKKSKDQVSDSKGLTDQLWEMVNQSQSEFYIFDAKKLNFIFVNQGALKNLGYTFEEIKNLHPYDIKPDFSQVDFESRIKPLLDGTVDILQFQTIHQRKNGTTYPAEIRLQLNRRPEGNFYFAVILDVTDKVKANQTIESLAKFPEENPSPVMRISAIGEILYFNPACQAIVNFWTNLYKQNVPEHWQTLIHECLTEGKIVEFEEQVDSVLYSWLFSASDAKNYVNCYARDITEQRSAENDQRQAAMVFDNSIEGIIICDEDNKIIRVNPAFKQITGYSEQDVLGKTPDILKSNKHSPHFYEAMWYKINTDGAWQGEIWNKRKNGEVYPEYMTISVLKNREGKIKNFIGIFADITERVEAEKRIHHLAYYDALTGLPNRFYIREILNGMIASAKSSNKNLALIYLDLKRFKSINESLGHDSADKALSIFSNRFEQKISETTKIGRMGGDEFLVVLPVEEPLVEESPIVRKVIEIVKEPINVDEHDVYIDTAIGIAHFPHDGNDVETLIKNAESAVSNAKFNKNSVTVFSKELEIKGIEHISFESQLRKALEKEEFVLHYQPQIDLKSEKVIGVEALLRWQHPEKGLIPPNDFIPLLEETGLIVPVGTWLIKKACHQILEWKIKGCDVRIAINLSAKQFTQKGLSENIVAILDETAVDPKMIEIEVTESTIMNRQTHVMETMSKLHDCNIKISIDDFGTGYSSLSYLKHFPIDVLKIDRSFVMELPHNTDDIAIVNTIISMGHNLNLNVIAEGVETREQADILKAMGCEFAQGFYFSRPIPADDCSKYILSTNQD